MSHNFTILYPPYDRLNNTKKIYHLPFKRDSQERLYKFVLRLDKKGCKFIVFNNNTEFIRDLYKKFSFDIIESYSKISRAYKEELLIYN